MAEGDFPGVILTASRFAGEPRAAYAAALPFCAAAYLDVLCARILSTASLWAA